MNATSGIERREFFRHNISLPVRFKFSDGKRLATYDGISRDIGLGGIFIHKALEEKEIGKELDLDIGLPDTAASLKGLKARICWVERRPEENKINGLGIRFTQIFPEEKEKLQSYLTKIVSRPPFRIKIIRPPDFRLTDKEKRNLEILDILRRKDPISRTNIAQEVNLNIVTISNYIDELKKLGVIFERGLDESSGGRRPSLLEINPEFGFIIGAELNLLKNYMSVHLVDFAFRLIAKRKNTFDMVTANIADNLGDLTLHVIEEAKVDRGKILGMGIGVSGLSNGGYLHLRDTLEKRLGLPLLVEDGSVADIFKEVWVNLELTKKENILYVGLDGSFSMMLRGDIYLGPNRGRLRLELNEARKGSEEEKYCWLEKACLLRQDKAEVSPETAKDLGMRCGVKIAYLINLLNPDVVIVGKIPEEIQVVFIEALRQSVKRWAFQESVNIVKIIPSPYSEDATALGVAALVSRDIYSQI